jgi:alanyl-tRNA synthetase
MLGNFSFGDYYKREAIGFAVEFLFEVLGLKRERFWVTVYEEDDEAFDIWAKEYGFPEERIVRLGKDDNFWEAGPVGPCGPCSELIIDRGEKYGCGRSDCKPGCDCDRFLEVWNLVFMQYNKNEDGTLTPLPKKNIDTGMGLERISFIMQGVENVFETDLLFPILKRVAEITGVSYGFSPATDRSLKIITDHLKASTFLLADGVLPSNEGRGYILRRLIRRSLSHSRKLGFEKEFVQQIGAAVIEEFGDIYPELKDNREFILTMLAAEEKRFLQVIERGLYLLGEIIREIKQSGSSEFPAEAAFQLYDTYGFPLELTMEYANEEGLKVDVHEFNRLVEESREKARESWKAKKFFFDSAIYKEVLQRIDKVEFTGYTKDEDEADLLAILKEEGISSAAAVGDNVEVVLSNTPFYPEGGGQVGDTGKIVAVDGSFEILVEDTQRPFENLIVHRGKVTRGVVREGARVKAYIDKFRRRNIERNHTATHLLHWALRITLGEGVKQAGSFVGPDYLRFDFPFDRPLTEDEIYKIEKLVNQKIAEAHPVRKFETTIDYAREIGAIALFGEKYGEYVRVIESGDFSRELCGGTHVNNTADISIFVIKSEHSIGSGLRRIEALTGKAGLDYVLDRVMFARKAGNILGSSFEKLEESLLNLIKEKKKLEEELEKIREKEFNDLVEKLMAKGEEYEGVLIVKEVVNDFELKELKRIIDVLKAKGKEFATVIGTISNGKPSFFVAVSKKLSESGLDAGLIAREAAHIIGGGGGGSKLVADAGGKNPEKLPDAIEEAFKLIKKKISGS